MQRHLNAAPVYQVSSFTIRTTGLRTKYILTYIYIYRNKMWVYICTTYSKTTKDFVINPTKYPSHSILFITMNRYGFPFLDYISFFDLLYNSNIVLFVSTKMLCIIFYLCSKPGRKMAEVETFKVKRSTRISEVLLEPQTVSNTTNNIQ